MKPGSSKISLFQHSSPCVVRRDMSHFGTPGFDMESARVKFWNDMYTNESRQRFIALTPRTDATKAPLDFRSIHARPGIGQGLSNSGTSSWQPLCWSKPESIFSPANTRPKSEPVAPVAPDPEVLSETWELAPKNARLAITTQVQSAFPPPNPKFVDRFCRGSTHGKPRDTTTDFREKVRAAWNKHACLLTTTHMG